MLGLPLDLRISAENFFFFLFRNTGWHLSVALEIYMPRRVYLQVKTQQNLSFPYRNLSVVLLLQSETAGINLCPHLAETEVHGLVEASSFSGLYGSLPHLSFDNSWLSLLGRE